MGIEKDSNREAFESWFESRYDAHFMQFALDLDMYADKHTQTCWEAWQAAKAESHKSASLYQWEINHLASANQQLRDYAAKAQAVPEGFVLVPTSLSDEQYNQLEEVMQDNFGTTVSQSRDCITKIHNELVLIAQEPAND